MERHIVKIKGGKVSITVEGVKGSACQAATRKIEAALGRVVSDTPTPELYESETTLETSSN